MKKWLKWVLGVIAVIVVVVVVYVAWNWTMFSIVSGTGELSGESSVIPEVVGIGADSLFACCGF